MAPRLLLASNSPRRRQLLGLTGWNFDVRPAEIDERPLVGEAPRDYVLRLAQEKARAAAHLAQGEQLILAADTTVADGMTILGKPDGPAEAFEMLASLRGREHLVYTAIAVYDPFQDRLIADLCTTRVWMRTYSDEEINVYIASGDPFDKAGAYAIQNAVFHPVERMEGCYGCVMGLALCQAVRALRAFGLDPLTDVAQECQADLGVACAVYRELLGEAPDGSQRSQT